MGENYRFSYNFEFFEFYANFLPDLLFRMAKKIEELIEKGKETVVFD